MNELILILSVPVIFGGACLTYKLLGKGGLYAYIAVATVMANIEVALLIKAFGVTQTLGNILFASVCLCTDILSENEGKKCAQKGVWIGIAASVFAVIITGSWFLYNPTNTETYTAFKTVFAATPRIIAASLLAFAISQTLDVFLYHKFWNATTEKSQDKRKFLWLRNNAATLISQVANTVIFNIAAFGGVFDTKTLISVIISGYVIFIFTSLADTPFVYLARRIKDKERQFIY